MKLFSKLKVFVINVKLRLIILFVKFYNIENKLFYLNLKSYTTNVTNHPLKASYHRDTIHQTMRHEY